MEETFQDEKLPDIADYTVSNWAQRLQENSPELSEKTVADFKDNFAHEIKDFMATPRQHYFVSIEIRYMNGKPQIDQYSFRGFENAVKVSGLSAENFTKKTELKFGRDSQIETSSNLQAGIFDEKVFTPAGHKKDRQVLRSAFQP